MLLTDTQLTTLRAAVDRIVPPDDGTPGALEAGALEYLLRQFEGDLHSFLPVYREGLDALNTQAEAVHDGKTFAELTPAAQDALLTDLDTARSPFFRALCEHTQEGFYISPLSWDLIGWKVTDESLLTQQNG